MMVKQLKTLKQIPGINGNREEEQKRIRRVQNPIEAQDVVNKQFADATYAPI